MVSAVDLVSDVVVSVMVCLSLFVTRVSPSLLILRNFESGIHHYHYFENLSFALLISLWRLVSLAVTVLRTRQGRCVGS